MYLQAHASDSNDEDLELYIPSGRTESTIYATILHREEDTKVGEASSQGFASHSRAWIRTGLLKFLREKWYVASFVIQ